MREEAIHVGGQGAYGKSLYLPLNIFFKILFSKNDLILPISPNLRGEMEG